MSLSVLFTPLLPAYAAERFKYLNEKNKVTLA